MWNWRCEGSGRPTRNSRNGLSVRGSTRMALSPNYMGLRLTNWANSTRWKGNSTDIHHVPGSRYDNALFLTSRSSESGRSSCVFGMQSKSIRGKYYSILTTFTPTDRTAMGYCDARKGLWMQITGDRIRFHRRTKETELGNIFSNEQRERILVWIKVFFPNINNA